ncbi:MAG: hypothetical protein HQ512_15155 [Rhodospirillales bacterium]|nr:hypothetical protein [Rhodospirillales bacterium]
MALFGKKKKTAELDGPPRDISWIKSPKNVFYRFFNLDPDEEGLKNMSAVFVLWHGGYRPEWIHAGKTDDMAATINEIYANEEIMDYDRDGKLFITWSQIKPEFQDGVVLYLNQVMTPSVPFLTIPPEEEDEDEEEIEIIPIPVYPPGVTG